MKAVYDPSTDTRTLEFKPSPVAEGDEDKAGIILNYAAAGDLAGIEIVDASRRDIHFSAAPKAQRVIPFRARLESRLRSVLHGSLFGAGPTDAVGCPPTENW